MRRLLVVVVVLVMAGGCLRRGGCPDGEHYEWVYDDTGTPQYWECVP